jgi:hypothetical protein
MRISSERRLTDANAIITHAILLAVVFAFPLTLQSRERPPKTPQINSQQKSDGGLKTQSQTTDQKGAPTPAPAASPENAPSVAAPKSQWDARHSEQEGTEFWPPFFGLRLKITDSLLALFTFFLFVATWFLYWSTRDLVEGADRTAKAQLRAYVHYGGCRYISHIAKEDGHIFWRIRPHWVNAGSTPTRNLRIYAHYELLDEELQASYGFVQNQQQTVVPATIPPHGFIESGPAT